MGLVHLCCGLFTRSSPRFNFRKKYSHEFRLEEVSTNKTRPAEKVLFFPLFTRLLEFFFEGLLKQIIMADNKLEFPLIF